ncbi:MAG: addiction module protein [Gammaproteobacteria bacterium]
MVAGSAAPHGCRKRSAAWLQEAQRRIRELEDGSVTAVPAAEVIAKARDRLRNVR